MKKCKVENCDRKHKAQGYCEKHYNQFRKHGHILEDKPKYDICQVEGCNNKHYGNGYCEKHYNQIRRHGTIFRTMYDSNEIIQYEEYAELCLYNKQGEEIARALIDLEYIDLIKQYKWHLRDNNYVSTGDNILLHRLIMNCNDDMVCDHINHNRLDNRRENLRTCTQQENVWNQVVHKNNTSGYTGVYKRNKKWCAKINVNGKQIHLGTFETFEEAKQARQIAEVEYYKDSVFNK